MIWANICPLLSGIDNLLVSAQFSRIERRSVYMELITGSPGINTADDAVEPISDYWEEYVGQWIPRLHAAGLLCCGRCVHMSHLSMCITEDAQEDHSLFRAEYVLKPRQTLEYVPRNMNNGFWPISHLPYVTDPTLLANI